MEAAVETIRELTANGLENLEVRTILGVSVPARYQGDTRLVAFDEAKEGDPFLFPPQTCAVSASFDAAFLADEGLRASILAIFAALYAAHQSVRWTAVIRFQPSRSARMPTDDDEHEHSSRILDTP